MVMEVVLTVKDGERYHGGPGRVMGNAKGSYGGGDGDVVVVIVMMQWWQWG